MTGYLEGVLDSGKKAAAEIHLANCTACRETFAQLMRLLNRQGQAVSVAEETELTAIGIGWKGRPDPIEVRSNRRGRLMTIVAMAASLTLAVFLWNYDSPPPEPESVRAVVESMLKQNRPFEPRLTGQAYRELERTRSARQLSDHDRALIVQQVTGLPADPYSLGRFYLLERDFERAIPLLEEAAANPQASPEVLNDLGAAYLARGDVNGLDRAERELLKALRADAGFEPAVFNLALFYERIGDVARAQSEWQRYLQMDSQSGWSGDARSRLR
jgi:tetratricopeptide (TPR) repeat protein